MELEGSKDGSKILFLEKIGSMHSDDIVASNYQFLFVSDDARRSCQTDV